MDEIKIKRVRDSLSLSCVCKEKWSIKICSQSHFPIHFHSTGYGFNSASPGNLLLSSLRFLSPGITFISLVVIVIIKYLV